METKNIPFFCFWIKPSYWANSMKNVSSMSINSNNLGKPHFGYYFCCSLVNFKNLIILFWKKNFFVKKLKKYCVWFGRYKKWLVTHNSESLNSIPASISRLLQKFHFPVDVVLNILETQEGLELVFRPQFS